MQEHPYKAILDLNNRAFTNSLRIAICQFGFELEHTIVSKDEFEEFLLLPPGDLWYYVYKQKLLCENLESAADSIVPDVSAFYQSVNSNESINFSIRKRYTNKRIGDSDEKYGIIDFDMILDAEKKIEYPNPMIELPDACRNPEIQKDIYTMCTPGEDGFLDNIGCYEWLKENGKATGKIGIRFFKYLFERKTIKDNDNVDLETISIVSPAQLELLSVNYKLSIPLGLTINLTAISDELDQRRIPKSIRKIFKAGIHYLSRFPLYLADDAVVIPIKQGKKWGIINCKYNAYLVINEQNDITLFDQAKFELKTYPRYWILNYDADLWEKKKHSILYKKFKDCHYPVSKYFKIFEKDKRIWQIYKPMEKGDLPEFHVIFSGEKDNTPEIYITQYIKVSIKNPEKLAAKLSQYLVFALYHQVNVLCLPELAFFLPGSSLQKALQSVYTKYLTKALDYKRTNRDYILPDMLIVSSTYFKPYHDSHCHINLGVGVHIHFDDSGIITDKIKVIPFQKQVYSPIEYTKNNITPGIILEPDDQFLKWLNFHYWEIERSNLDIGDKQPIRLKCNLGNVNLYPFICSDFIADKIFKSNKIMDKYKARADQIDEDKVLNIITISAYSSEVNKFYENIKQIKYNTNMVVFSNTMHPEAPHSSQDFGRSFIYYQGMRYKKTSTDLFHFDKIHPVQIKKTELNFKSDYGIKEGMIVATIVAKKNKHFCEIYLPEPTEDYE